MTATLQVFSLFYVLTFLISLEAHGLHIQTYRNRDFTGPLWSSRSNATCSNDPYVNRAVVNAIKTDTCVIVYNRQDCKSPWSQKFMPGETRTTFVRWIESFHICNEEEGGTQLIVDITEYYKEFSDPPAVLQSYKNVCSCVNVPQYVQNMSKWSINNHHNDMFAYYEPDCSENKRNSIRIAAGHNPDLTNMEHHKNTDSATRTTYKIQSFGPERNSTYFQTSCNSPLVTTETATTFRSTTEIVMDTMGDLNITGIQVVSIQSVEMETQPEVPEAIGSTTESEFDTKVDSNITGIQVLANQIVELQTQIDQLNENLETIQQQGFNFTETNTQVRNECSQNFESLSEKIQKLENGQEKLEYKMETQTEEMFEVIARLQAFLQEKL